MATLTEHVSPTYLSKGINLIQKQITSSRMKKTLVYSVTVAFAVAALAASSAFLNAQAAETSPFVVYSDAGIPGAPADLFTWQSAGCSPLYDGKFADAASPEGTNCLSASGPSCAWLGWGIFKQMDMRDYTAGEIRFYLKSTKSLRVELEGPQNQKAGVVVPSTGGAWQAISLPVSLFAGGVDLSRIYGVFLISSTDGPATFYVDYVRWVQETCSYSLSDSSASFRAGGGSGSLSVASSTDCVWAAVANQSWLHTTSSGSGNGTVNYTVDANTSASPRSGTITVGGQSFTVTQGGVPPAITQQPVSQVVATGATAYFTVGVTGSGLFFRWYKDGAVLANNAHISGADSATLVIAGAQAADAGYYQAQIYNASGWTNSAVVSLGVCYNVFSPASAMFAAAGGSGSVSNACGGSIVASASVYWLHITSGGSGGVSHAITYSVDANTSASTRTGTITVGGQSFTVTQAGVPPVVTRQPTNQAVAVGATAYFTASATGPSLTWQWQKDGANLTEGGHYTGVYTPTLVVNNVQPGDAGQYSVWVSNAAGWAKSSNATLTVCAYSVSAANAGFGPSGGTNSVIVSHNCGLSYSVTNPAPWVHILSGAAGATPGTLVYRVDANPAATARSAVLAISGQTHTVFQAGTDTWTIYWQHTNGTLAAYYMDGTNLALNGGILLTPSQIDPTWQLMAAADLNRDGRPELLWQHQAGALALWNLNGTVLASAAALTPAKMGPEWKIVATPDLSGDGKAEVLWQSDAGWLGLWFMDGATMTNASYLTPNKVDPNWRMAGALDLNGDSRPEILWRHKAGSVGAWFLNGLVATNYVALTPEQVTPSWQIVGAGNRKADGKPMILWQSDSGEIGVWYLNGTTMESFSWLNPSKVAPAWRIRGMTQP